MGLKIEWQVPCVGVAEMKISPAGIVSPTMTFEALSGPSFVTTSV
jgi:hypothetical protein